MEIISILEDKRIKSINILTEFTIQEYLKTADDIIRNNPFQRKRVKSSSTVYSLLRDDLKLGCIIPPIVLALNKNIDETRGIRDLGKTELEKYITENLKDALILDGLQRTYNIIDANDELEKTGDTEGLINYHNNKIRCEFYLGIDKIGILYRMLTLNTGQTPMSLRHQIEILYSDYLKQNINGITLFREIDEKVARTTGQYSFKEVIEGFTSYLLRDYLTFDRSDILENIKSLEKLSKENQGLDIFTNFIQAYHTFQLKMVDVLKNWKFQEEAFEYNLSTAPFGKDAISIFNKSQTMTGFGAAIGFLKDQELSSLEKTLADISKIKFDVSTESTMDDLLYKLDEIRKNASKIGNAQRAYFYYFFRELFNENGDSYLSISLSIENAYKRYRQNV